MTIHTLYTVLWLLWLATFFAIELPAILKHRGQGDTLSEHVWDWFAIKTSKAKGTFWRIRRVALIALFGMDVPPLFDGGSVLI